jgi:hypothetical protein
MELNLTPEEIRYLQKLVLSQPYDLMETGLERSKEPMSVEDHLLVKLQDALDESAETKELRPN